MENEKIQATGEKFGIAQDVIDDVKNSRNGQLASYIERIERLEKEKKELQADIREIFAEAKGNGFDVKAMRQVLTLRKMTPADRAEIEFLRDEYKKLLGLAE